MWRRQLGYLLHPDIPVGVGTRIADIACGTGHDVPPICSKVVDVIYSIWLLDLAKKHPLTHLDGFDISVAQFPPREWLPVNTTLSRLDILQPVPESLRGTYDVVHVGLVAIFVEKDDPLPLLDNLLALLSIEPHLLSDLIPQDTH